VLAVVLFVGVVVVVASVDRGTSGMALQFISIDDCFISSDI
jgi:hypothetical protein